MLLFCVQEDGQPFPSLYFLVQGKDFLFFLKLLSSLQKPPLLGEGGSQWILQLQTGDPVGFRVQSVAFSRLFLQKPGSETLGLQGGSQETQSLLFLPASPRWAVRYGSDEGYCPGKWLGSCCGSLSQPWDGDSETHCCMHEG